LIETHKLERNWLHRHQTLNHDEPD